MIKKGTNVIHTGDGREGKVIGSMVTDIVGQDTVTQILVEYQDAADRTSQAWFREDLCKVVK